MPSAVIGQLPAVQVAILLTAESQPPVWFRLRRPRQSGSFGRCSHSASWRVLSDDHHSPLTLLWGGRVNEIADELARIGGLCGPESDGLAVILRVLV